jgi:RNA polymerase sigma-70 factor, ECF subfamily
MSCVKRNIKKCGLFQSAVVTGEDNAKVYRGAPNLLIGRCVIVNGRMCVPPETDRMELSTLLGRCRCGDELAWEALVRQFQARVYGVAYHYVENAEDARDLAQEAFIRIYQNLTLCTGEDRFLPWIIRITRNICIDHLRRKKSRPPAQDIPAEELSALRASGGDPAQLFAVDSRKRLVHNALQGMTDLNREMILLRDIQGLPLEEIASMLNVPLGTVKSRSNRARIELAQKLSLFRGELSEGSMGVEP